MDLLEKYNECSKTLEVLDEQLDSRDGGTGSVKSKIIKDSIEATKANWEVVANNLVEQLSETPDNVKIGFFYGLMRKLEKEYNPVAKKYIDEQIAAAPKVEPLISDTEVPVVTEQRKEIYNQIKAIIAMAEAFSDPDLEKMAAPRRRGGAPKGKRGPRAISYFSWSIEDAEFDNLKEVVEALPYYDKVADLTKAIRASGVNLTTPPAQIEFELPNGKVLVGVNSLAEDDDDDEGDEDNEDSAEDTEEG